MRKLLAASSIALFALFSAGCADESEPGEGEEDVEIVEFEEGTGQEAADHAPDAAYPPGPYGFEKGSVLRNVTLSGYPRPQDGVFERKLVQLSDFYNPTGAEMHAADSIYGEKPKPKALLIIMAAEWCGPCQQEAKNILPPAYAALAPQAEFITLMVQNNAGNAPQLTVLEKWLTKYNAVWPGVVDGQEKLFSLGEPAFPSNLLIKTSDMTIIDAEAGIAPGTWEDQPVMQKIQQVIAGTL